MDRDLATALAAERAIVRRAVTGAREIDGAALEAFQELAFADDAGASAGSSELPARIAATQASLRSTTGWRAFGAGNAGGADGGLPASAATLYLDPDAGARRVAFVDQVFYASLGFAVVGRQTVFHRDSAPRAWSARGTVRTRR